MAADVVSWATSNVGFVLTLVVGLVAAVWAAEAIDEAEDRDEALGEFGSRAKEGTGGALNVALVGFLAVAGWASTAFATAGDFGTFALSLAPDMPVVAGSLVTISLGAVGLSDVIVLQPLHFIGLGLLVLGIAVAYRRGFGGGL